VLVVAQVLAQLRVQCGLQDRIRQPRQQPVPGRSNRHHPCARPRQDPGQLR
jgi:hypothetical protein